MTSKRLLAWSMVAGGIIAAAPASAAPPALIDGGRLGTVRLSEPEGEMRGLVVLFSRHGAPAADDDGAAAKLSAGGALVIEVDTDGYLVTLDGVPDKCLNLGGDIEGLSRQLQHDRAYATYRSPILAGIGLGGALAEAALAQVPSATFAGAVSIDPAIAIPTRRPLCPEAAANLIIGGYTYGPDKDLQGFWSVGLTSTVPKPIRTHLALLASEGTPVAVEDLAAGMSPGDGLAALVQAHLDKPDADPTGLASLPLVELPVDHPSTTMAIVLSGDGGWRDLDKTIAENLQRQGVPTVGWDSLRYFWSKKTPEETTHALAAVMKAYMAKWHASKVALIGYSFGADVLPFTYNRLTNEQRGHVVLMALLGFANNADFEITMGGWLGAAPSDDALPILPEVSKVPPALIQCFYGAEEDDTVCPALADKGVEQVKTTGGHHFDGDYAALAKRILDGVRKRGG
ncbi:MAG TPA: AcvB/VirJ family lysyl-phosphatidylglycerol hydrolase [Aliidongia sp.]|uniref:virulence factor family protein n=1 Tax=Aliidongia sp. TaxID=1914230 RepID=UPI002DDD157B|nr:AcvB/VirJ family lysyl-phosphatidylglycerol hydrolase [Aliidongia sp.]HEV2672962.1 AcvB/VirJ family lysyl-phosphatidylglycerol hydrolase [Aliidongia sp.]